MSRLLRFNWGKSFWEVRRIQSVLFCFLYILTKITWRFLRRDLYTNPQWIISSSIFIWPDIVSSDVDFELEQCTSILPPHGITCYVTLSTTKTLTLMIMTFNMNLGSLLQVTKQRFYNIISWNKLWLLLNEHLTWNRKWILNFDNINVVFLVNAFMAKLFLNFPLMHLATDNKLATGDKCTI